MPEQLGRYRSALEEPPPVGLQGASQMPGELAKTLALLFLSAPVTIENRWFNNQDVTLDGFNFVRCRFDNCRFLVGRGAFKFDHCLVAGGSAQYSEEAGRIVRLYSLPAGQGSALPQDCLIRPMWHEDGTFSIG